MKSIRQFLNEGFTLGAPEYKRNMPAAKEHPFHGEMEKLGYAYYGSHQDKNGQTYHTYSHDKSPVTHPVIHLTSWKVNTEQGNVAKPKTDMQRQVSSNTPDYKQKHEQHAWSATKRLSHSPYNASMRMGGDAESLNTYLNRRGSLAPKDAVKKTDAIKNPLVADAMSRGYQVKNTEVKTPPKTKDTSNYPAIKGVTKSSIMKVPEKETTFKLQHPKHGNLEVKTSEDKGNTSHEFTATGGKSGKGETAFHKMLRGKKDKERGLDKAFMARFRKRESAGFYAPRDFTKM